MMLTETTTYEEPVGELLTVCLRIESLLLQAQQTITKPNNWCSHLTMLSLFDLIRLTERSDLKVTLAKELQRHLATLLPLTHSAGIDQKKLQTILGDLESLIDKLHASKGKFAQTLRDNEFLKSAAQLLYPAMPYSFESPAYHYWLQQSSDQRIHTLKEWLSEFSLAQEAVALLLRIVRESSTPKIYTAEKGAYQFTLGTNAACQLVRISLPKSAAVFPRITISRHRVAVQFYLPHLSKPPTQATSEDISFQMMCCGV